MQLEQKAGFNFRYEKNCKIYFWRIIFLAVFTMHNFIIDIKLDAIFLNIKRVT